MARYQAAGTIANPGGGAIVVPTPTLPGDADVATAINLGATVALADRIGIRPDPGNAQLLLQAPAPAAPTDVYYAGRFLHSLPAGARAYGAIVLVPAGAPGTLAVPHGLGVVPDFISAVPDNGVLAAQDWAVTAIDDVGIDLANWDGANPIAIMLYIAALFSIDTPLESAGPQVETLAGVAPQVWAHGLGRVPDYLGVFPWAPGLVQPAGMPVLNAAPDLAQITVAGNFAGAAMDVLIYAQGTNSIQA